VTPTTPGGVIRWAAGPLRFELATDDPAVRSLAMAVFRPWATRDGPEHLLALAWRVDRLHGNGAAPEWRVRSSAGSDVRMASAAHAVSTVEVGAISALLESSALIVHGALVAWDGRGVLLAGRGEAGKSTLACALWARGAALLGDDVAIVDPVTGAARTGPRRVSLRAPSRAVLGDTLYERTLRGPSSVDLGDSRLFHPDEIEPYPRTAAVPLAAIVFLARLGSEVAPARREPIPPAHALLALLPYTNRRSLETLGDSIRALAPLADRVPAFDLGRGPLASMAETVEALVGCRALA
jgi:hypothetical protein